MDTLSEKLRLQNTDIHHGTRDDYQSFRGKLGNQNIIARKYIRVRDIDFIDKTSLDENILNFIGSSRTHQIFERYACSLRELKEIRDQNHYICGGDHRQILLNVVLLDDKGCPTETLIHIFRDIFEGLTQLRRAGRGHGNLNPDNVTIVIMPGSIIRAKLTGMRDKESLNDFEHVWSLLDFVFKNKHGSIQCIECNDLLHRIRNHPILVYDLQKNFSKDPNVFLKHPLFWTPKEYTEFFLRIGGFLSALNDAPANFSGDRVLFFRNLENNSDILCPWNKEVGVNLRVESDAVDKKGKYFYNFDSIVSLFKYVRNTYAHYAGLSIQTRSGVGFKYPEQIYQQFRANFPGLAIHAYVVYNNSSVKLVGDTNDGYMGILSMKPYDRPRSRLV